MRDLRGRSEVEIGAVLELYDSAEEATGRCRRARDDVVRGRELLADLGAWPWALDEEGRLERHWWTLERYAVGLLVWHEAACMAALEDAMRATRGRITARTWRSTAATWQPARDLYRAHLAAAVDAAGSIAA